MEATANTLPASNSAAAVTPMGVVNPCPAAATLSSDEVELHRVNLRSFIEGQNGHFVAVDFTKLSGERRMLVGRLGVVAPLKGGRNLVESEERPYLTAFDVQAREYRTINLSTLTGIRAAGRRYRIVG